VLVTFPRRAAQLRDDQRGGVLVMVAVWLPVLLIFVVFVVEVGNWFQHKRHLQLQADAGALAGGGVFRIPCSDGPIETTARNYAGDPVSGIYNFQVPPTDPANVHVLINSERFWNEGGSDHSGGGAPCAAKMIDVKITEANLPWFFGLNVVPAINAHARVEIRQKETSSGGLPVGVPDNNPLSAAAIFIDEANGNAVRGIQPLTKVGPASLNDETLTQWTGSATPVDIASSATSVVIVLSGLEGWTPSGTLSSICGQVLVECYQGADIGPWVGLSFIHGYATTGTGSPTAPIVRDVTLYSQTCADGSAPSFLLHAGCNVGVKAKIDFGTSGDPSRPVNQGGIAAKLRVDRAGTGCPQAGTPKGCNMVYHSDPADPSFGYWTTDGSNGYPFIAADGIAHRIDLNWQTSTGSGMLLGVQRSYSAGAGSDPVRYISVSEIGPGANSLSLGSHDLSVTIGVKSSLQANSTDPNALPVALKVVGGSQNQAIDCEEGKNLQQELATGCTPQYTINKGTPCPSYNTFLSQPEPWNCVRTQTGGQNGQVYQGMIDRIQDGSTSCVNPNHWADVNGDGMVTVPDDIPEDDPRLVPVFVTPFGSFNGNGNNVVPVVNFATFYVTGFSRPGGPGQGDPCPGADPVPSGGGYIVGHFIKYVESINTGGGGPLCDFSSFGTCVAVLTQ
jgi:hypothetical protein